MKKLTPLGKIAEKVTVGHVGSTSKYYCENGIPFLRTQNIGKGEIDTTELKYITPDFHLKLKKSTIRHGDVLVSRVISDEIRCGIVPASLDGANCANIILVRPGKDLYAPYLKHLIGSPDTQRVLMSRKVGSAQSVVNTSTLKSWKIPLPPLTEQKRIAAILDKADAIRRKRQAAIKLADDFLRATFLDMFGDPVTNPKGWDVGTLGDFIHSAKDGPHVSPNYSTNGVPFLSTRHVRPGKIIWEDLKYISREEAEKQWRKCKPEKGDILYTKGGTTGIAAVFDSEQEIAVWVHVALLKTNHEKADSVWLENMLNTAYCYAQSQRYTHGITNKDLGLTRMVNIKMYSPPLELQNKFSTIVAKVKSTTAKHAHHEEKSDNLFNSLTQRAFRGEL